MKHERGQLQELSSELLGLFRPVEGLCALYYGRIRNGKTYAATSDILDLLERGESVFANWNIDFPGFDERKSFKHVFIKTFFGRNTFFSYKRDNFHYFDPDDIDVAFLGRLVNAHIFIDEGQWIFNSHQKDQDPEKRRLILHNGHYCRTLNIITQRPVNVFKDMRSQIHVWYKCEKYLSWPVLLFSRTSFYEMKDDIPDEDLPGGRKIYFASKKVLAAYSTHAMRAANAIVVSPDFDAYKTTSWDRVRLLLDFMLPSFRRKAQGGLPAAPAPKYVPPVLPHLSANEMAVVPNPSLSQGVKQPWAERLLLINDISRIQT